MSLARDGELGHGGVPDIGLLVREYEPIREVGRGGMGTVVLARHRMARHEVAIKISAPGAVASPEAMARLSREAKVLASLRHPNVVRLYDIVDIGRGRFGIVMEYVRGESLSSVVAEHGPLHVERCRSILGDLASALSHAHARGIVHRDVKPHNVLVHQESWAAKLCDFGIARGGTDDGDVTATGIVAGTPAYMAPEAIDGKPLDLRSDLYSLGLLGWEILTGQQPWRGLPLFDVLYHQKHADLTPVDSLRRDCPPALSLALEGALAKEPQLRWRDADEFLAQLSQDAPTERLQTLRADRRAVEEGNLELERDFTLDLPVASFAAQESREQYPLLLPAPTPIEHTHRPADALVAGETATLPFQRPAELIGSESSPRPLLAAFRQMVSLHRAAVVGGALTVFALTLGAIVGTLGTLRGMRAPSVDTAPAVDAAAIAAGPSSPVPAMAAEPTPIDATLDADAPSALAPAQPTLPEPLPIPPPASPHARAARRAIASDSRWSESTATPSFEATGDVANPERMRFESVMRHAKSLERAGRMRESETLIGDALRESPRRGALYAMRAHVRAAQGRVRDAWTDIEMASRLGGRWDVLALEARLLADRDGEGAARLRLQDDVRAALEPPRMLDPDRAFGLARALVVVGDERTAVALLERSRAPDPSSVQRLRDPVFEPLATDPRFDALRRRIAGELR